MDEREAKLSASAVFLGTATAPGIGTVAGALVPGFFFLRDAMKATREAAKAGHRIARTRLEERRERRRIASLPPAVPPRPRTVADDYNDLMSAKRAELAAVELLQMPDDEKEVIREMIEEKYAELAQQLFA